MTNAPDIFDRANALLGIEHFPEFIARISNKHNSRWWFELCLFFTITLIILNTILVVWASIGRKSGNLFFKFFDLRNSPKPGCEGMGVKYFGFLLIDILTGCIIFLGGLAIILILRLFSRYIGAIVLCWPFLIAVCCCCGCLACIYRHDAIRRYFRKKIFTPTESGPPVQKFQPFQDEV